MEANSLDAALRRDAEQWRGNHEELSRLVCGSGQGLRHKLSHFKGQFLRPHETVALQQATGGRHFVTEMARQLGGVFLMMPPPAVDLDNQDLLLQVNHMHAELGRLLETMNEFVRNDGVIDGDEKQSLDQQGHEVYAQILRFLALTYRVYGTPEVVDEVNAEHGEAQCAGAVAGAIDAEALVFHSDGGGSLRSVPVHLLVIEETGEGCSTAGAQHIEEVPKARSLHGREVED
ncbi:phage regulatory CII family protein [Chromobacterium subtsugae]|uniref:phage regulatory CII family protein n=1 Tax=Chromobacterium subtsugae TaxID=251747 RepID=UPI000B03BE8F|nr:phage regulatory CII family protein [Chromobacterium subtsugae]